MLFFDKIKNNKNIKNYKSKRKEAIADLRSCEKDLEVMFSRESSAYESVRSYIKEKNIKEIVYSRIEEYKKNGDISFVLPPFMEAVTSFLFWDMMLLEAQGNKHVSFNDSINNMLFILS